MALNEKLTNNPKIQFNMEAYQSAFARPTLVDSNNNVVKVEAFVLDEASKVKNIYFRRIVDGKLLKADEVFIVQPKGE